MVTIFDQVEFQRACSVAECDDQNAMKAAKSKFDAALFEMQRSGHYGEMDEARDALAQDVSAANDAKNEALASARRKLSAA
jgi:hypothetical protein